MSQEYLSRIFSRPESNVLGECTICLEAYNTLNTATGVIEAAVRLSCGHTVGSACIATWFRDKNSCPLCREILFPMQRPESLAGLLNRDLNIGQSRPVRIPTGIETPTNSQGSSLGGVNFGGSRTDGVLAVSAVPSYSRSRESRYQELSVVFGEPVRPLTTVALSIEMLMRGEYTMSMLRTRDLLLIEAVSTYITSYLLRRPRSPEAVSTVFGVDPEQIRQVYRRAYNCRMQFIDPQILGLLAGNNLNGLLEYLPRPHGENRIIDDEAQRQEIQHQRATPRRLANETHDLCHRYAAHFGGPKAYLISNEIIKVVILGPRLGLRSPAYKASISLYMAAHLLGHPISSQRTAEVMGINENSFKAAYARVYPVRDQFIKPIILQLVGMYSLPRALEAIPALNWPPLEY